MADTDSHIYSGMLNLVGAERYAGKGMYEGMENVLKFPKIGIHLYKKQRPNLEENWTYECLGRHQRRITRKHGKSKIFDKDYCLLTK